MTDLSAQRARDTLAARLQARRPEIEQATLTRVNAISDSTSTVDPIYVQGLRGAVTAALDHALAALERGERRPPPPPPALLTQARLAARNGVSLDKVLRRYFAGYTLLGDFLVKEAEHCDFGAAELKRLLRALAAVFDQLLAAVSDEYTRDTEINRDSGEQRRAELTQRLLNGELLDTSDLAYDLDASHVGLVADQRAAGAIRDLATALDRRLLLVAHTDGAVWAWLGGWHGTDIDQIVSWASSHSLGRLPLAIGEPGDGLSGWRLTHRQAAAALPIALHYPGSPVCYADVALLASALQDDLLATSLHQLYLAPLEAERDGGETLRETLRAYFTAERNVSSAAAALGVKRHTVTNRLRAIEQAISRPLSACATDMELALRMSVQGSSLHSVPVPSYA